MIVAFHLKFKVKKILCISKPLLTCINVLSSSDLIHKYYFIYRLQKSTHKKTKINLLVFPTVKKVNELAFLREAYLPKLTTFYDLNIFENRHGERRNVKICNFQFILISLCRLLKNRLISKTVKLMTNL